MLYAAVGILAFILNLILNREQIKKIRFKSATGDDKERTIIYYTHFLLSASGYFIADIAWGILYENRNITGMFPLLYISTAIYFLFMILIMLAWMRYILVYLHIDGQRGKALLGGAWIMFIIGAFYLIINWFYPVMFTFNSANEYVEQPGRHVLFILQITFYIAISAYTQYVAHKSTGQERFRHKTVALTSVVIGVFLILQIMYFYYPSYAMGLMIGICVVHSFVEFGEKNEKAIHDHIASAMAEDYEVIYYIDLSSGEFLEFSKSRQYESMNVPTSGSDFFEETMKNIEKYVFPDDIEYAKSLFSKEVMLSNLEGRHSFSFKYRILVRGVPRFFLFTAMRATDSQYLILYEKDIQDELMAEKTKKENQKKTITFGQIAESLASNYDEIYYVNVANSSYVSYVVNNLYGKLQTSREGNDFFKDSYSRIPEIIHRNDRDMMLDFINRDNMLSTLQNHKDCSINYRITISGKSKYSRLTARKTSDGTHLIIGVENIDEEIRREKEHLKALKTEKELARRDELTGVKNKTAYKEFEESVQANIDNGMDYLPFALVVCDANNLKKINDTQGHVAGDEYLKASANLLCNVFVHSPVFRVGGDEFVVFLRGNDYLSRLELMNKLQSQVLENQKSGNGTVVASGMSEYDSESDNLVTEIFDRADREMYQNKQRLKEMAK